MPSSAFATTPPRSWRASPRCSVTGRRWWSRRNVSRSETVTRTARILADHRSKGLGVMKKLALLLSLLVSTIALADDHTLYQTPTLSRTRIAFAYAGDLWSVPRDGGLAERLTTHVGVESDPHFSPDGSL